MNSIARFAALSLLFVITFVVGFAPIYASVVWAGTTATGIELPVMAAAWAWGFAAVAVSIYVAIEKL